MNSPDPHFDSSPSPRAQAFALIAALVERATGERPDLNAPALAENVRELRSRIPRSPSGDNHAERACDALAAALDVQPDRIDIVGLPTLVTAIERAISARRIDIERAQLPPPPHPDAHVELARTLGFTLRRKPDGDAVARELMAQVTVVNLVTRLFAACMQRLAPNERPSIEACRLRRALVGYGLPPIDANSQFGDGDAMKLHLTGSARRFGSSMAAQLMPLASSLGIDSAAHDELVAAIDRQLVKLHMAEGWSMRVWLVHELRCHLVGKGAQLDFDQVLPLAERVLRASR